MFIIVLAMNNFKTSYLAQMETMLPIAGLRKNYLMGVKQSIIIRTMINSRIMRLTLQQIIL